MDYAQQGTPSIRRTEQLDRLEHRIREAIINVVIDQHRANEPSSPPIWWSANTEHASSNSNDPR